MKRVELHQVAMDRLLSLTSLEPDNEKAFFNLGMITMDEVCKIPRFCSGLYLDGVDGIRM